MHDLHAHVLPGVDDGARDLEECVAMARVAAGHGTRAMLATPHSMDVNEGWSVDYVRDLLDEVNGELRTRGVDLGLLLGMENHLEPHLPEWVSRGKALPINGTRYILVEFPFYGRPNYAEDVLFQLQLQGLVPVLAHPERIAVIQEDPELLARLVGRGMLSQVTAGSLTGSFGEQVRRFSLDLLRDGLVHVLASDAHFAEGLRSPALLPGVEAAAAVVGEERARWMVEDAPRAIMEGRAVEVEPPVEGWRGKGWRRLWRA